MRERLDAAFVFRQVSHIKYISLCSGVEAASLAWLPLDWEPVAYAELDDFPSAVLAARFPETPNLGDVTKVDWSKYRGAVSLVVGGTPCQAFSIAGKREGLLDDRGKLMLEFVRAVREIRPQYVVWENVVGALSQDRGRAFGTLIRELVECGYSCVHRVIDAQLTRVPVRDDNGRIAGWFGPVAQRRRRLFLVAVPSGSEGRAAEILALGSCLQGDHPSSSKKREELTAEIAGGFGAAGGDGTISGSLNAQQWGTHKNETLIAEPVIMASGQANAEISRGGVAPTIVARNFKDPPILFEQPLATD